MDLVNESVRVSQVLFDNNMATRDVIYRSKAEKLKIEQNLASSNQKYMLARSYFNFLLNRDLETAIIIDESGDLPVITTDLKNAETQALNQRNEIKQLTYAVNASQSLVGLASANYYPRLNIVFDYGFQGAEYRFSDNDDYWMASAVLSWNLFNGFQDYEKRQQAQIENKILQVQLQQLKDNIRLQVKDSFYVLDTAKKNYESAREQENYSNESYKIISKKYEQGLASQIELIDARVNMTNSKIGSVVNYYNYLICYVEFLQLTGALTIEN